MKTQFEECSECGFKDVMEVKEYKQYVMNQGLTTSKPIFKKQFYTCAKCGKELKKIEQDR